MSPFLAGFTPEQLSERIQWVGARIRELSKLRKTDPECRRLRKILAHLHMQSRGELGEGGAFNSEQTTTMFEGPFDIPVVNQDGATPIERKVRIIKSATAGSATSGYYANLVPGDFIDYVQLATSGFKIKEITSWSLGSEEAIVAFQTSSSDELLGNSVSNFTRIGEGFCGIITKFPMGDWPLYLANETANIIGHNVGSQAALKVVFDVILELLI
jgi:hypothetical protein